MTDQQLELLKIGTPSVIETVRLINKFVIKCPAVDYFLSCANNKSELTASQVSKKHNMPIQQVLDIMSAIRSDYSIF